MLALLPFTYLLEVQQLSPRLPHTKQVFSTTVPHAWLLSLYIYGMKPNWIHAATKKSELQTERQLVLIICRSHIGKFAFLDM